MSAAPMGMTRRIPKMNARPTIVKNRGIEPGTKIR
jgi:hypothetical protein